MKDRNNYFVLMQNNFMGYNKAKLVEGSKVYIYV